jgi:DNA-binding protein Fis
MGERKRDTDMEMTRAEYDALPYFKDVEEKKPGGMYRMCLSEYSQPMIMLYKNKFNENSTEPTINFTLLRVKCTN